RTSRGYEVRIEEDGDGIPSGASNLVVVAARATARAARQQLAGLEIVQRSSIPTARGLGSSAAAIVAGCVAANEVLGRPLDRQSLLRTAARVEGHPDNVAAGLRKDGTLLRLAMHDRLHEAARMRLVPALDFVARAARAAGAFGAVLSGAGPSVLAIAPARLAPRVAAAMAAVAEEEGWLGT